MSWYLFTDRTPVGAVRLLADFSVHFGMWPIIIVMGLCGRDSTCLATFNNLATMSSVKYNAFVNYNGTEITCINNLRL